VNFVTKLLRRMRRPDDPEAELELQRSRAWKADVLDRSATGPRGIEGLAPPKRDVNDPRR
jgi:hypothetical protein